MKDWKTFLPIINNNIGVQACSWACLTTAATISTIYLHSTNICISRRVPGHVKQQQPQLVPPRGQARQVEEVLLRPVPRGQQGVEGESYLLETRYITQGKCRYIDICMYKTYM